MGTDKLMRLEVRHFQNILIIAIHANRIVESPPMAAAPAFVGSAATIPIPVTAPNMIGVHDHLVALINQCSFSMLNEF